MTGASADPVFSPGLLAGKVAVVTGAGSGIGRAIALRLAGLGAHVTGIGRRAAPLAETAMLAEPLAGSFAAIGCDVRDVDATTAAIDMIGDEQGIDLLVNNAGGQFYAPATAITRRGWDAVVDLNLSAVFSITLAARAHLARAQGSVVSISLTG
ncbi:MAG: SDR family NAD(P)-dependent oxidoreductase, partial [Sphingomonadales bacterium]